MDAREEAIARHRFVGRKMMKRPALFTHPGFTPLEIDRPESKIGRFGREADSLFALSQCSRAIVPLLNESSEKKQGKRHENEEELNRKRVRLRRVLRERTSSVGAAPNRQECDHCNRRRDALEFETHRRPEKTRHRQGKKRGGRPRGKFVEQNETDSGEGEEERHALDPARGGNLFPAAEVDRRRADDQGRDRESREDVGSKSSVPQLPVAATSP